MKGSRRLTGVLNALLAEELSAVNQYTLHAEMAGKLGYNRLRDHFAKRAVDERKHAEQLIARILLLDGEPISDPLKDVAIGGHVPQQLVNDHAAEAIAIAAYNAAIKLAGEVNDFATREILEHILSDEDAHIDKIEEFQDQISHMTLPIFLTTVK